MTQAAIPARGTSQMHLGWLGLGVLLVVVALLAGAVGYLFAENQGTPANADQAIVASLDEAWSTPYDAAKFAALYAPDANFYDNLAHETSTGLAAIQAKASTYSGYDFRVTSTSAPIRQGDFVAVFERHGTGGQVSDPGIVVMQVKDGKIQNQWVYPAQ